MKKTTKKILIVGGSSNIGRELIKKLSKKNYEIFITFNKNKLRSKDKKEIIQFKLDITSNTQIKNLVKKIKKLKIFFDKIIFLQCQLAGKSLDDFNTNDIRKNLDINFTGQVILLKKIKKQINKNCLIIFISSISAVRGSYDPIYAASKGAIVSFVKSLSTWWAPEIKSICLLPGVIKDTEIFRKFSNERKKFQIKQTPNAELLNKNDLSKIIIDLLESHWRHANGSIININGGAY